LLNNKTDFAAGLVLGLGMFRFQLVLPLLVFCVLRVNGAIVWVCGNLLGAYFFPSGCRIGFVVGLPR